MKTGGTVEAASRRIVQRLYDMVAGREGATPDIHGVQTGFHVMIVGAAAKNMQGYARTYDADPTKP